MFFFKFVEIEKTNTFNRFNLNLILEEHSFFEKFLINTEKFEVLNNFNSHFELISATVNQWTV
jgi:hypothetical protein